MKTSNVEGHGSHATDATRGRRSALLAGAKGMVWRDASTESVGQIRDMTVYGAEFVDHEDGTGDLIIGGDSGPGPGGGTGGDTGAASIAIQMLNNSGGNLDVGAVVIVDDTEDDAVTTTTTAESTAIVGVVMEPIEADAIGPVLFNGYTADVTVTGTVARGDYLETSTTAGVAQASATREAGTFGVVTAGADISAFFSDYAATGENTGVTSLSITMPDSVTDPDSAGRLLFLALWRDSAVTSDPTITGWTRIGSTSGFWYYTRVCTVGDTASASWTGSSPAVAIVALLDPIVASVEDFAYDATNSAAAVTGLDDNPRYAMAAVAASAATPAGWTALASASAVASGGASATNLAVAGTKTNDPANTANYATPSGAADGSLLTGSGTLSGGGSAYYHVIRIDLGSAAAVSQLRSNISDGGTDTFHVYQYSTDATSWTTPPGTWSAKVSAFRTLDLSASPITARYWRFGWAATGFGNHQITEVEVTGTSDQAARGTLVGQYIGRASSVTSPFSGASAATDAVFALNLHVEPKPSAILYGPDLGGSGSEPTADAHIADATDAHDASAVSFDATGLTNTSATEVQTAIEDLDAAIDGIGTGLPWFNVKDYGAVGDGSTDDTTEIQDTIDAAVAAGGGVIYFPPGEYIIGGALQDTSAFNGQILLPDIAHSGVDHMILVFKGALRPGFHPVYGDTVPLADGLSVLKSTLTGATGTASVFSGSNDTGSTSAGHGNNLEVYIDDLVCLGPDNPTFSFWNLAACQGGGVGALQISTPGAFSGSPTQPTNTNAYGIKFPGQYMANTVEIGTLSVGGFYTGVLDGELTNYKSLILGPLIYGIEFPTTFYPSLILRLQPTATQRVMKGTGDHRVDVLQYVAEHATSPAWAVTTYDVDDASNHLYGDVTFYNAATGGTADHLFTKNGGANITGREMGAQRDLGAGTAMPTAKSTNDRFYRTDLQCEFIWDGTRWISLAAQQMAFPFSILPPLTGTGVGHRMGMPGALGGSDVYLGAVVGGFYVAGGTALSGSHKWVGTVSKNNNLGSTSLGTITIDSGASSTWRALPVLSIAAAAAVSSGFVSFEINWVKTGTPGDLYATPILAYRTIAT